MPISAFASPLAPLSIIPSQRTILASTGQRLKRQRAKIQILSPLLLPKGLLTRGNTSQEPFVLHGPRACRKSVDSVAFPTPTYLHAGPVSAMATRGPRTSRLSFAVDNAGQQH